MSLSQTPGLFYVDPDGLGVDQDASIRPEITRIAGVEILKARVIIFVALAAFVASSGLQAQDYGARLGVQRGGARSFEPSGSGVMFGTLDPTVQRWYLPQELYDDYRWRQDQPATNGSSLLKNSRFNSWFNNLVISSDSQGQYAYAITVGTEIRTTLTPMTFSKPRFDGVQVDIAADKYAATVIASRISEPGAAARREVERQTNTTSLVGGRATVQVGDFITLGGTLVDASNANTALDMFGGNLVAGNLTAGQSATPVNAIAIVLSDDSPEDGVGGAALFDHDIRVVTRDFETGEHLTVGLVEVVRAGSEWPVIFGGFSREGFVAADGSERIVLNYDFTDPAYIGPDLTSIVEVEFEYLLANDYKIEMWSNRHTGLGGEAGVPPAPLTNDVIEQEDPALLTVARANGNIKDITNVRVVRFNYGLPTANLVGGFTVEGQDFLGFDFYGEWDRNVRYSQYPNAALFSANRGHEISSRSADAYTLSISRKAYPFFAYGELYSVEADYSTSAFVTDPDGGFTYDSPSQVIYEFVDDNDDQDRRPDWSRVGSLSPDREVFPVGTKTTISSPTSTKTTIRMFRIRSPTTMSLSCGTESTDRSSSSASI